ncbi:GIP [Symbiodinium sp. CCMP2592]|nr:GIP [Symbiodinium sp. CCMP2592]
MPWEGNRTLLVAFSLQAKYKLGGEQVKKLSELGFPHKISEEPSLSAIGNPPNPTCTLLRQQLLSAEPLLKSSTLMPEADHAVQACQSSFRKAQAVSWDAYQDSMLTYQQPLEDPLDVLEIGAQPDSRITERVQQLGGKAQRFTNQAMQTFNDFWVSWAGSPKEVYLDPAGEFRSEQMLEYFQILNARTHITAAAWQRGRLERHGDILKDMLSRLDIESPITDDSAFDQMLLQAVLAKNSLIRHSGFSPEKIVFGKALRVPGSLSSDEDLTAHALAEGDGLESERYRQRLELRCRARRAFMDADNSQAIRRATLRRSNPVRGPFTAGMWVLYWIKKSSPNRLAAGRWHGPAKVICIEGTSVVWLAHGTNIIRSAPENLRPASLREWQHLTDSQFQEPLKNAGGASSYLDLTGVSEGNQSAPPNVVPPASTEPSIIMPMSPMVVPNPTQSAPVTESDEIGQPEQELTPQVSQEATEVERAPSTEVAAPSGSSAAPTVAPQGETFLGPHEVPIPESDEGLMCEHVYAASSETGILNELGQELINFTTVQTSAEFPGPPLAEDGLPFVTDPLQHSEHQAFCLEVPIKPKDLKKWLVESAPEQLITVAAAGKRSRAEVCLKGLSSKEVSLFEAAKQKEITCWLQTSAIRAILRRKLNPEQILKSRWILTWKPPEEGETQHRAKARLVVLGYQDPKLVEVMRDAPTLSREGRALVLQTIASKKFRLGSVDIKTAFLRGKADETNPLAMEPPKELRKALNLKDDEVCQLLGNAYGRGILRGILGMHVDDGVCGGDKDFGQVGITFLPIEIDRLTFVSFGDASFASSKCLASHQGALICATDDRLLTNQEAPLSPLTWSSKKIPRVVRSTLSAEAYAMSKAVDMLGWCAENTEFRWVPTTLQAADCLTKAMDSSLLRTILAQGRFKLYDVSQDLQKNAQRKQAIEWLTQTPKASLL